jgi:hypothetical protein
MPEALNPALYGRLREEFGRVNVSQPGAAASTRYGYGPFASEKRLRLEMLSSGEYYRINCPYCGDSRQRLWINHLWGVPDEHLGKKNLWLCHCYNENCFAVDGRSYALYERIYGFRNANMRGKQIVILQGEIEEQTLREVKPPGQLLPLTRLPPNDKVVKYMLDRNWDPMELQLTYGVSYCLSAESEYYKADGRIVIPIHMHGKLVGWQCRYPADLDWKEAQIPKYYSMPNMPRRLMLYNYDNAIKSPYVVVCEGPTDVWNVGSNAVAAFGKHLTVNQLKLLCDGWSNGAVVLLLDGDAHNDTDQLVERLREAAYKGKVIPVYLPDGTDPGSFTPEVNRELISGAAAALGVDLYGLNRDNDDNHVRSESGPQLLGPLDQLRGLYPEVRTSAYSFDVPRDSSSGPRFRSPGEDADGREQRRRTEEDHPVPL